MTYQQVLEYLYTQLPMYQRVGQEAFKKDLSNTVALLNELDNPHNRFKTIHVAGTNGKGSVTHMLAAILQEAGYKTGIYTSPHLKSFTERIKIDGIEINESFVVSFVNKVLPAIERIRPSFFEITVAMAFDYFKSSRVDIAVIETGLGGRLDSTNVITPLLSIITSIGLDHQDILGETIEKIAAEKAGIIKFGVPIVCGNISLEALGVIRDIAFAKEAQLIEVSEIGTAKRAFESDLRGLAFSLNLPTILASVDVLNETSFSITEEHIALGLSQVCKKTGFKGRWQVLSESPYIVCDIGHNEEAMRGVASEIHSLGKLKNHIVIGMSKDKSVKQTLLHLPKNAEYYFCAADLPRAMQAHQLMEIGKELGLIGDSYSSVREAIDAAQNNAKHDDLVFIGGSAFVVAEIEDL